MSDILPGLDALMARQGRAVLVTMVDVRGSSPREAGTRMAVGADGRFIGTIGGGALEWQALAESQKLLRAGSAAMIEKSYALGPDLGQCCGGRVVLRYELFAGDDGGRLKALQQGENRLPILLFGAGHVGRALVLSLAPLPFEVRWVDARRSEFPSAFPPNVTPVAPSDPVAEIAAAEAGTAVLILTHSHALDLALVDAALRSADFSFVGVIGSATKRARFMSQLRQMGHEASDLERLTCPIGLPGLGSKAPAVIAAGVAVQMLQVRARVEMARRGTPASEMKVS